MEEESLLLVKNNLLINNGQLDVYGELRSEENIYIIKAKSLSFYRTAKINTKKNLDIKAENMWSAVNIDSGKKIISI